MAYSYLERLETAVRKHEEWRNKECLNLIASENFCSPEVRQMLTTDLGNRYTSPDKYYRGNRFLDEVQSLAEETARKLFSARFADVRPLSGHSADTALLMALTKAGDKVLSVSPKDGGYPGISEHGLGRLLELRNFYFPYDERAVNIKARETRQLISAEKPAIVIFGSSFIPFPQPVREISDDADGSVCVYDGSHVMGLIAGGEFQDPLREGCSLLVGSTHKTLPGPQGGIILSNNEEVFSAVTEKIHPGVVDNVHWNRVAALTLAMIELIEFGKAYAQAVVRNSAALGKALSENGVKVRGAHLGYSKSHQVLLEYEPAKCAFFAKRLEEANIIIDNGGRVGVAEATRMGMGAAEMEQIAELIGAIVMGKKPADVIKKRVRTLTKDYRESKFVMRSAAEAAARLRVQD